MRKIAVLTGTRAEYGLLYWLMRDIAENPSLELQLIVTGMHLSPEFGHTDRMIEKDGFQIDERVEMLLSSDSSVGVAKSVGLGLIGMTDSLFRLKPDIFIILGDRYEALAAAQAALFMRIPIAHIHGGEITEGAYDDAIRHAITKLSHIHFTSTEEYRRRVIQLGEAPENVFNVGAPGLEHLRRTKLLGFEEFSSTFDPTLKKPFFLVTYHPATLEDAPSSTIFAELTQALDYFPNHQILITYPNSDDAGREIIERIKAYVANDPRRIIASPSLGQIRYLSALKHADLVIGNSSSGIIEAPSFEIPTINIGQRQAGRIMAKSVFNCEGKSDQITKAIKLALCAKERSGDDIYDNPYGDGNVSQRIIHHIDTVQINKMKKFHDLETRP